MPTDAPETESLQWLPLGYATTPSVSGWSPDTLATSMRVAEAKLAAVASELPPT